MRSSGDNSFRRQHAPQSKKKKKKKCSWTVSFRRHIGLCARYDDLETALTLYSAWKESNNRRGENSVVAGASGGKVKQGGEEKKIDLQTYVALLNLCDGGFVADEGRDNCGDEENDEIDDGSQDLRRLLDRRADRENFVHVGTPSGGPHQRQGNGRTEVMDGYYLTARAIARAIRSRKAAKNEDDSGDVWLTTADAEDDAAKQCVSKVADICIFDRYRQGWAIFCEIRTRFGDDAVPENAYSSILRIMCRCCKELLSPSQSPWKGEDATEGVSPPEPTLSSAMVMLFRCTGKLRLYSSVLLLSCLLGDVDAATKIWDRCAMRRIELSEAEYAGLLALAVSVGRVDVASRTLDAVAKNIKVPSKILRKAIIRWYACPYAVAAEGCPNSDTRGDSDSLVPATCPPGRQWTWSEHISADRHGKICKGCCADAILHKVHLSDRARLRMRDMIDSIVRTGQANAVVNNNSTSVVSYQGGRKGLQRAITPKMKEHRVRSWESFVNNLVLPVCGIDGKAPEAWNVLIDGANVGYFQQNFDGAPKHVNYEQIDWVVRHFTEGSKPSRVLLVLHERHFYHNQMPDCYRHLEARWHKENLLYRAPGGSNDDWFWMYAALHCPDTMVVTNDEMRDHTFQMVADDPPFLKWKERSKCGFSFGEWSWDYKDGSRRREVLLERPREYGRWMQGWEGKKKGDSAMVFVPEVMCGDERRYLDGKHVEGSKCEGVIFSTNEVLEEFLCFKAIPHDKKEGSKKVA